MIPLFKSSFSIGESILKPSDLVEIAQSNNLERVVLVEDNFYGFRVINKAFLEAEIPLVYGVKLPVVQSSTNEKPSKLIFFPKNNRGIVSLRNLYTQAFAGDDGCLIMSELDKSVFNDIKIGVPFYGSYVYNNIFHFGLCDLSLEGLDHVYFEEDNNHPFDFQIKEALSKLGVKTEKAKSIYYKDKEDFAAFQMYKAVCNRFQGRVPRFSNPRLNDFCSDEFCLESYLENHVTA